ncbi:MAG: acyltransferase [Lachnospiraceae bacterium]|nr:acyltransferase [Lachnospiraceae bacterium]
MHEKNMKIENIRCLAIFLVVLGHSIIMYSGKFHFIDTRYTIWAVKEIKDTINVLEMPLFMSVSGFVFYYSLRKTIGLKKFLSNKVFRIMVPYVLIGCFWVVPTRMVAGVRSFGNSFQYNIVNKILFMEDSAHLWYLPCLFVIFTIMYILHKIIGKQIGDKSFDIGVLIALFFVSIIAKEKFTEINKVIQRIFMYLFWFDLGFLIHKYELYNFKKSDKNYYVRSLWYIMVCSFCMCIYFGWRSNYVYYAAALFGVLGIYSIIPQKTNKFFKFVSKNSYGIYLLHSPMVWVAARYMPDINAYIMVLFNVVILGGIAIGMTCLLRKSKLKFIIGE